MLLRLMHEVKYGTKNSVRFKKTAWRAKGLHFSALSLFSYYWGTTHCQVKKGRLPHRDGSWHLQPVKWQIPGSAAHEPDRYIYMLASSTQIYICILGYFVNVGCGFAQKFREAAFAIIEPKDFVWPLDIYPRIYMHWGHRDICIYWPGGSNIRIPSDRYGQFHV